MRECELKNLVRDARGGDLSAYSEIVRRFQDMAVAYAYSILGDWHYAEDAAQETFVSVYRNLAQLRDPVAFSSWLRQVVHSCCCRQTRRKRLSTVDLAKRLDVEASGKTAAESLEEWELKQDVHAAIRSLPEKERTVTALYYMGGHSQAEISAFLGISAKTVKSRLHTARRLLKEEMIEMVKDELHEQRPSKGERFTTQVFFDLGDVLCLEFLHDQWAKRVGRTLSEMMKREVDVDTGIVDAGIEITSYRQALAGPVCCCNLVLPQGQVIMSLALPIARAMLGASQDTSALALKHEEAERLRPHLRLLLNDLQAVWNPLVEMQIGEGEIQTGFNSGKVDSGKGVILGFHMQVEGNLWKDDLPALSLPGLYKQEMTPRRKDVIDILRDVYWGISLYYPDATSALLLPHLRHGYVTSGGWYEISGQISPPEDVRT